MLPALTLAGWKLRDGVRDLLTVYEFGPDAAFLLPKDGAQIEQCGLGPYLDMPGLRGACEPVQ